jgi:hypothetical protein
VSENKGWDAMFARLSLTLSLSLSLSLFLSPWHASHVDARCVQIKDVCFFWRKKNMVALNERIGSSAI